VPDSVLALGPQDNIVEQSCVPKCGYMATMVGSVISETSISAERRLPFEGARNLRDLGGYPVAAGGSVRWKVLYRSDSLAELTPADLETLTMLNLHTLIDFRTEAERKIRPNRLPPGLPLNVVEIGFLAAGGHEMLRNAALGLIDEHDVQAILMAHYQSFPVAHNPEYRQLIAHIERAVGRPVLFHCTSGKDRTGFGAAVILLALGARREAVLEDYVLTNHYKRDIQHLLSAKTSPAVAEALMSAEPRYLRASFKAIDEHYGSDDAYLERGLGLGAERREKLRTFLTEAG
jgi:protein-tyrosine phosphatase